MKRIVILPLVLGLVASCDKGGVEMKNASVQQVGEAMRKQGDDKFIDPGKWQQTVTLVSIDAPGMPKEARDAMQGAMSKSQVNEVCLSPEEARSPREDFFAGKDQNCRYEHFNWGSGKIDLRLMCDHPNARQQMTLAGTYAPKSYSMTMTMANQGKTPQEQMTMTMKVDAKNVGQCTAKG
jgi:hypothetical protein